MFSFETTKWITRYNSIKRKTISAIHNVWLLNLKKVGKNLRGYAYLKLHLSAHFLSFTAFKDGLKYRFYLDILMSV